MSWELERDDGVVVVRMTGTKPNVQNDVFEIIRYAIAELDRAADHLLAAADQRPGGGIAADRLQRGRPSTSVKRIVTRRSSAQRACDWSPTLLPAAPERASI